MYSSVLAIHSWLRWITIGLAVAAILNAARPDTDVSRRVPGRWWDVVFMMALDFQVLFGLLLYFGLSPFTRQGLNNIGSVMANADLRFWTVDHFALMAAATVLVRIGRVLAISAPSGPSRRRRRLTFFALTTLAIIAGIPWPGTENGRPLFRW